MGGLRLTLKPDYSRLRFISLKNRCFSKLFRIGRVQLEHEYLAAAHGAVRFNPPGELFKPPWRNERVPGNLLWNLPRATKKYSPRPCNTLELLTRGHPCLKTFGTRKFQRLSTRYQSFLSLFLLIENINFHVLTIINWHRAHSIITVRDFKFSEIGGSRWCCVRYFSRN